MSGEQVTLGGGLTTGRVETLVDGVFAVVMTLLVLDVKVPVGVGPDAATELPGKLLELWPRLSSFALSFVIAGVYWVGHHNQYHFIRRSDRMLLWINLLFLLCVAFIPFSTALLGEYPQLPIAACIYGLNLVLIGLVLYGHWWYATSDHRLVEHDIDPHLVRIVKQRILIAPAAYTLAILLSFFWTGLSLVIYLLVPALYIAPGAADRHWRRCPPP